MAKEVNLDAFADRIAEKLLAAKQQANDAGQNVGEEFVEGVVKGIKEHSKDVKTEMTKLFEDFNKTTNNFKSRKSITNSEWTRVLGMSRELLKSERYADSVRTKLDGIAVTIQGIGKVSGLTNVLKELEKAEDKLESVQWSEAGKNYRKKTTINKTRTQKTTAATNPKPAIDAEKKKQQEIVETTNALKEEIEAQQKLTAVQKEADNLAKTKKNDEKNIKNATEALHGQAKAAEKAADAIKRTAEEQKKLDDLSSLKKNQESWLSYLDKSLDKSKFKTSGKREATNNLRSATNYLISGRRNNWENAAGEYAEQMAEVAWTHAYQEAERQGVANSTLVRYNTDASYDYEENLRILQQERDYRQKILNDAIQEINLINKKTEAQVEFNQAKKDENILYHAGDLSNPSQTQKTYSLGHVRPGKSYGVFNGFTGLYTTEDVDGFWGNEWAGAPISTIDASQYKLFDARTDELATRAKDFFDSLNGTIYGYIEDFATGDIKKITDVKSIDELWVNFQEVFTNVNMTFEQFFEFVKKAQSLVYGKSFDYKEGLPALDEAVIKTGEESALQGVSKEIFNSDSFQTQLLKMLGFEGIDLRGTKYNGTYTGGTVLFEIKPESINTVNEKWSDVMAGHGYEIDETALKHEEKRRQLAFDTAKAYGQQTVAQKEAIGVHDQLVAKENEYQQEIEETNRLQRERQAQAEIYAEAGFNLISDGYESISQEDKNALFMGFGEKIAQGTLNASDAIDKLYASLELLRSKSESMPDSVVDNWTPEVKKLEDHVNNLGEEFKASEHCKDNFNELVQAIKDGSVTAAQAIKKMSDVYENWELGFFDSDVGNTNTLNIQADRNNPLVKNAFRGMHIKDWVKANVQPGARGQLEEELYKLAQTVVDDDNESFEAQIANIVDFIIENYKQRERKEEHAYEEIFKQFVITYTDDDVAQMGPQLFDKAKSVLGRRLQKRTDKNKHIGSIDQFINDLIVNGHVGLFSDPYGSESYFNKFDEFLDHYASYKAEGKRKTIDFTLDESYAPYIKESLMNDVVANMRKNISNSAEKLDGEQLSFGGVAKAADEAAKAKERFAKANQKVGEGAAESADHLDDEADNLDEVSRAAAGIPDVSAYDSASIRLDANGNPYRVSGTARTEMEDGFHYRTTGTYQFDEENNRWDYLGSVQSSERTREMVQALEEYYKILNKIQKLSLDTSGAVHAEEIDKLETEDLVRAYQRLLDLGVQVNDIEGQVNLSVNQRQALLDVELRARQEMYDVIAKMEDKQATSATKQYQKTVSDELKKSSKIDSDIRLLGEDGASARLQSQVAEYRRLVDELVDLRLQLARNPELANDADFSNRFTDTANRAQRARVEIEGVFKESQKLQKIGRLIQVGEKDVSGVENLKSEMIAFANSALDGEVKITGFNKEGNEMYVTLNQGAGAVENITVALNKASGHLQAFTTGTSRATNEWEDFKTKAVAGAKNIVGMYFGLQEAIQAGRKGVEYVKEIDLAMTELKKVTDETDASYKQFLSDAGGTAAVIGSTISDFTEATATFARLGYDLDLAESMAETSIIYKNVADGLDTVEEASDSIISTMMAFGVEADNTMSIIDKYNEVGNRFAITSAGIGEALQRSASALFEAGNTIDESIALVTAAM